jgi:amino acid adenylation domain-containing protein
MDSIKNIIEELKEAKAQVFVDEGRLRIDSKKGTIDDRLKSLIKIHKESLINYIKQIQKEDFLFIPKIGSQTSYPLSSSQRRLWILSQFEESSIAYNMPGVYEFEGRLDKSALSYSFTTLLERHESLRTIFKENEQGEIRQCIISAADTGFRIGYHDLREQKEEEKKLKELIQNELIRPFDLATGPLLSANIYQVENNKWVFTYIMHHIISDGWSVRILIKELLLFYSTYIKGEGNPIAPLRIQYRDYAAWQQEQLSGETLNEHKVYWLKQFSGVIPVLELLGDKIRPAVRTYNGGTISKRFNTLISKGIKSLIHEEGSTLFMGLLAVVKTLLYRYTGQEDIIIGSPIAGREHIDLEDQIGFYTNTLALRTSFKGTDSYNGLLKNVKQVILEAYQHQTYPFDDLVDDLHLERDRSRHPIFDVMVVLQNTEINTNLDQEALGELKVCEYEEAKNLTSKFDLLFNFIETGEGLYVDIEYNSDIYTNDTAERLGDHLGQLLEVITEHPDTPINQLEFLSRKEKQKLLVEFNNPWPEALDYPKDKTVKDLFEEQVSKTPGSTALVFEETTLSYKELNGKSNQLARYLRKKHTIKTGDLIGIKLERSEWIIIAILGVLKSGGAYVPIDPEYPEERISYMLSDSRCKVLIDEQELENFRKEKDKYTGKNLKSINKSGDLAYVMYTSGSTGTPKGVMIEHSSIVRLVKLTNYVTLTGKETLLSTGAVSFDATTFEYWSMLLNGGRLVMCGQEVLLNFRQLAEEINQREVDIMWFTSGWLNELVDRNIAIFKGLKTVLAGGDKLSAVHINALRLQYPCLKIINGYGPTENTTFSLTYPIDSVLANIPLGRPINNSTVYITDNRGQLLPIGVVGEICVGGVGLARGYLNKPELTSENFVPNPFKDGERMYKTGDLGRWLVDGNIEFIGRKDNQVKIRGYRIELGEIENVLQSYKGIDSAVVIAKINKQNEKELVACIVSKETIDIHDIRGYLNKALPAYMQPHQFVQLTALPLTPNGKVDRKQLENFEVLDLSRDLVYVAPRNKTEKKLIQIWQDVLGIEKIGLKDNFFELGGHSLKATRVASQIYKEFEVKITLKELFVKSLLEEQAQLIQQLRKTSYVTISPVEKSPGYPLSSSQRRLWILSQFEEGNIAYNIPGVYVFEGNLDNRALEYSFTTLLERHESLRTIFKEDEKGEIGQFIISMKDTGFKIAYHDLRNEKEQEKKLKYLLQSELRKLFNLSSGPLVRAGLFQVDNNKWVFNFVTHHIISDGWSMGILINELLLLYNAHIKGETNPLIPLRIHYKDYSAWQQKQLNGETLKESKVYWLKQLEGELPVLELPIGKVRPSVKTYNGSIINNIISSTLGGQIKTLSQQQGGTLFMGLLAIVNILLYKYTSQEDIIIGSSIAGREHMDLEDQIGFYANTLALRTKFKGEDNVKGLIENIKQVTLDAYEHQAYPFDELVDKLNFRRDMSRNALFDVMMVLENVEIYNTKSIQSISNLKVSEYKINEYLNSKFDFTFFFSEDNNEIKMRIVYNSDLYEYEFVNEMSDKFIEICKLVVSDGNIAIREIRSFIADNNENKESDLFLNHVMSRLDDKF